MFRHLKAFHAEDAGWSPPSYEAAVQAKMASLPKVEITCQRCTYLNDASRGRCVICGFPLDQNAAASAYPSAPSMSEDARRQQGEGAKPKKSRNEVAALLNPINLGQYIGAFTNHGYETVDDIRDMDHEEMEEIGVDKKGHRKRIMKACAAYQVEGELLDSEDSRRRR